MLKLPMGNCPIVDCKRVIRRSRSYVIGDFSNVHKLVGVPYEKNNCWQLIYNFYRMMYGLRVEVDLKSPYHHRSERALRIDDQIKNNLVHSYRRADLRGKVGDLVIFKDGQGYYSHIGVKVTDEMFLHTGKWMKGGSRLDSLKRYAKLPDTAPLRLCSLYCPDFLFYSEHYPVGETWHG